MGSHGHSCHVRESPRKKGGGGIFTSIGYVHDPVFVEKLSLFLFKKNPKKIIKKIVRIGQMWSFAVRYCHMGSEIQPEVAYCIFILNYYFLFNKWPFF